MDSQNTREAQARFLRKQVPSFLSLDWDGPIHAHWEEESQTAPLPLPRYKRLSLLCDGFKD